MQSMNKHDKLKNVIEFINSITDTSEFEVSINKTQGITLLQYMIIAKYMIIRSESTKNTLTTEDTLDIFYNDDNVNLSGYRITISGIDRINRYMSNLSIRKNHSIFSILANNIRNSSSSQDTEMNKSNNSTYNGLSIMHKIKSRDHIIDMNEFDMRFRLSQAFNVFFNLPFSLLNHFAITSKLIIKSLLSVSLKS